jgi:hypothetical protein
MLAMTLGYVLFCVAFNYHARFAGYYHIQLVIVVSIAAAPVVQAAVERFLAAEGGWLRSLSIMFAAAVGLGLLVNSIGMRMNRKHVVNQAVAQEIGQLVNHSEKVVFVSHYYGIPLMYYSNTFGTHWPNRITYWMYRGPNERARSVSDRLEGLPFVPDFFVITNRQNFYGRHTDLQQFLAENATIISGSKSYLVYAISQASENVRQ